VTVRRITATDPDYGVDSVPEAEYVVVPVVGARPGVCADASAGRSAAAPNAIDAPVSNVAAVRRRRRRNRCRVIIGRMSALVGVVSNRPASVFTGFVLS
jgi:hypothetical protein